MATTKTLASLHLYSMRLTLNERKDGDSWEFLVSFNLDLIFSTKIHHLYLPSLKKSERSRERKT